MKNKENQEAKHEVKFSAISMLSKFALSLQKVFIPANNVRSKKRVSPPKRGAAEPVNLKIHRNPAKQLRWLSEVEATFLPGFLVFSKSV
jgi:hypothetical protein